MKLKIVCYYTGMYKLVFQAFFKLDFLLAQRRTNIFGINLKCNSISTCSKKNLYSYINIQITISFPCYNFFFKCKKNIQKKKQPAIIVHNSDNHRTFSINVSNGISLAKKLYGRRIDKLVNESTKLDTHLFIKPFIDPLIKTIISRHVNMFVYALARAKKKNLNGLLVSETAKQLGIQALKQKREEKKKLKNNSSSNKN